MKRTTSNAYHFIGIGGIGMSSLARILLLKKCKVSGSDVSQSSITCQLEKEGCQVYLGHSADFIHSNMCVIYSTGIKPDNPEFIEAKRLNCPVLHRSELLAELSQEFDSIAVTGTHGKTTTSALLASVFYAANLDPSFSVGGILPSFDSNSRVGHGRHFVFEADESDGSFLRYSPLGAIVTNIDDDHLNYFENSFERLQAAFGQFMDQVVSSKHLFWCGDDLYLRKLNKAGVTYGFSENCDWHISNFTQMGFTQRFDLEHQGKQYKNIQLALSGEHNALNATAVFGMALSFGAEESKIREAFRNFCGVGRRCQDKGNIEGISFIDDYAHHPTEIKATLKAIRQALPGKKIIAVFQPHRYSRTYDCLGQYGTCFVDADEVLVTDIYSAGEIPLSISSQNIIDEVHQANHNHCAYVARNHLSEYISMNAKTGDVFVTMGAGDITKVSNEALNKLELKSRVDV